MNLISKLLDILLLTKLTRSFTLNIVIAAALPPILFLVNECLFIYLFGVWAFLILGLVGAFLICHIIEEFRDKNPKN